MSLFSKNADPRRNPVASDSDVREAATERLAELAEYCAWERRRAAGRFDWADDIRRNLRQIQNVAPRYAAQAGDSPQAHEHLRAIMADSAVAIAKLNLRKEFDDRIDAALGQPRAITRSTASSDHTSTDAALFGVQAAASH